MREMPTPGQPLGLASTDVLGAWLPIETAPRDGTDALIYVAATREQFVAYWRAEMQAFVIAPDSRGGWIGLKTPTHWMPLPAPPQSA